jgi:hypothetical protein
VSKTVCFIILVINNFVYFLFIFHHAISKLIFHKNRPITKTMSVMSDYYFLFTDNKTDIYLHRCHVIGSVWSISACTEGTILCTYYNKFIALSKLIF